jgi:hypothetical protein
MAEKISLRFEFDKGTNLQQAADVLRERVSKMDGVESVEPVPEKPRFTGLEIVAAIGVGVMVVHGVRKGVTELRKLIHAIKELENEIEGVQDVKLEVGRRKVSLDEVSDADLDELAKEDDDDDEDEKTDQQA